MTVKEGTAIAKSLMSYKYLYGAKGQPYTKALVESLAKQYKSKFTAALKAEALKDADKGYKAGDCSFLVCKALGIANLNSLGIKNNAVVLFKPDKAKAIEGMALWKNGHVAYIGDGLKIYELRNTSADSTISSFDARAKDFTYMFVVKGSALYNEQLNAQINEITIYYPAWHGNGTSIVSALANVGEKDTSMNHRKRIAAKNGISGYLGTAKQNLQMIDLLKAGKLKKA